MNSKKTNWIVLICTFLLLVVFFNTIKYTSEFMLDKTMITGVEEGQAISIYGIKASELLYNSVGIKVAFILQALLVAIPNIVAAIGNIKNKKVAICQFLLGIIGTLNLVELFLDESLITNEVVTIIIYTVLPVILIIAEAIILFKQKEDVEETGARKTVNTILFYILQLIATIMLISILLCSLIPTKINDIKRNSRLKDLSNKIMATDSFKNNEFLMPVKKDGKYGFINMDGEEVIPCEYDIESYFSYIDEESTYCCALAKKDDKFYIISKTNERIEVSDKVLDALYNNVYLKQIVNPDDGEPIGDNLKVHAFYFIHILFFRSNLYEAETDNQFEDVSVELKEDDDSKYHYETDYYSMEIEDKEIENYNEDEDNYSSYQIVTMTNKENNTVMTNEEHIMAKSESYFYTTYKLYINTDGSISFTTADESKVGWYDVKGNRYLINSKTDRGYYDIEDINDGKIILRETIGEGPDTTYSIKVIDMSGKELFESDSVSYCKKFYILLKDNKLMLMDLDFNIISDEYDMIMNYDI